MSKSVASEGAPRDLGLDQGRALRAELRARYAERSALERLALRAGFPSRDTRALAREISRHFPHQAETLHGLAVGAGVPPAWLFAELRRELAREVSASPLALAQSGALLARALEGPWLVRRSRPQGLFASLELTRPWLTHALVGVNERGLAAAVVMADRASAVAPGALLAQDCLERFEALEAALEWCEGRPGGAGAVVLLADASGEVAGIRIGDSRVLRPEAGRVVAGGAPGEASELAKQLAQVEPAGDPELSRALPGAVVALAGERVLVAAGERLSL